MALRKALRFLVIATVVLYLGMVGVGFYTHNIAVNNTSGLCALRADAERRVDAGDDFLKDNPKGIPGISVEQLRRSIANSQRTVEALKEVSCPPIKINIKPKPTAGSLLP